MRPDTEPNKHAKRIMMGAFVLTIGVIGVHVAVWIAYNWPWVAYGGFLVGVATMACYVVGMIALDVLGGGV